MFAFNNEIYQHFVKKRKEKKERGYLTFVHIGLLNQIHVSMHIRRSYLTFDINHKLLNTHM